MVWKHSSIAHLRSRNADELPQQGTGRVGAAVERQLFAVLPGAGAVWRRTSTQWPHPGGSPAGSRVTAFQS